MKNKCFLTVVEAQTNQYQILTLWKKQAQTLVMQRRSDLRKLSKIQQTMKKKARGSQKFTIMETEDEDQGGSGVETTQQENYDSIDENTDQEDNNNTRPPTLQNFGKKSTKKMQKAEKMQLWWESFNYLCKFIDFKYGKVAFKQKALYDQSGQLVQ